MDCGLPQSHSGVALKDTSELKSEGTEFGAGAWSTISYGKSFGPRLGYIETEARWQIACCLFRVLKEEMLEKWEQGDLRRRCVQT